MSHPMEGYLAEAREEHSRRERNRCESPIEIVADLNCLDCKGEGSYTRGKLCGCISARRKPRGPICGHHATIRIGEGPVKCAGCGEEVGDGSK